MFDKIVNIENITLSYEKQLKIAKEKYKKTIRNNKDFYINLVYEKMRDFTFKMRYFNPFLKFDKGKTREIIVCTFECRIVQQAILNVCEDIFSKALIHNSYQAQKNKGIHKANIKIKNVIKKLCKNGDVYFLHIDIKKYYANIKERYLLDVVNKKIKDYRVMRLLKIVLAGDSRGRGVGVTLGNSISQWLGNMFLYLFDRDMQEFENIHYLRYADDMIFLSNDKRQLHRIKKIIRAKLHKVQLALSKCIVGKITKKKCLDTLGYKFFLDKILVRKRIKHSLSKAMQKDKDMSIASLRGHIAWANGNQLVKNLIKERIKNGTHT